MNNIAQIIPMYFIFIMSFKSILYKYCRTDDIRRQDCKTIYFSINFSSTMYTINPNSKAEKYFFQEVTKLSNKEHNCFLRQKIAAKKFAKKTLIAPSN